MIQQDRGGQSGVKPEEQIRPNPSFDLDSHGNPDSEVYPFEVENPGWSIISVARGVDDEEEVFDLHRSSVTWREIDDSSQLDPPKKLSVDPPRIRTETSDLSSYQLRKGGE